jgi:hypothetical protein
MSVAAIERRSWVDSTTDEEGRRRRERAVERVAEVAHVSVPEAEELCVAAVRLIRSKLPPSDLRTMASFRLHRQAAHLLRGISAAGTGLAHEADTAARRLAGELAYGLAKPAGAPLNLAAATLLFDNPPVPKDD